MLGKNEMGIPPAGKRDCYWAFKFERKEQLLVFEVSTGTMLDVYHWTLTQGI